MALETLKMLLSLLSADCLGVLTLDKPSSEEMDLSFFFIDGSHKLKTRGIAGCLGVRLHRISF
jgi:hypothetical protein